MCGYRMTEALEDRTRLEGEMKRWSSNTQALLSALWCVRKCQGVLEVEW